MTLLTACTSELDDFIAENDEVTVVAEEITIGAGMPDDEGTRVALNDFALTWEEGDELVAIGIDNDSKFVGSEPFVLVSGAGDNKAMFRGKTIPGANKYTFVYNCDNLKLDGKSYDIDYTNVMQNNVNDNTHLRASMLISADGILASQLKDKEQNIQLSIKNSFLRIDVRSLYHDQKYVREIKWLINYKTGEEHAQGSLKFHGNIEKLTSDSKQHNYLYMPFPATAKRLIEGNTIAFQFVGNIKTVAVSAVSTKGKDYKAGSRYDVTISDNADDGAINTWLAPNDNQIWVKFYNPANAKDVITVADDEGKLGSGFNLELSEEPNIEGWYIYSAEQEIKKITSLFSGTAYEANTNIKEVWLPSSLKSISNFAFGYCTRLKRVYFADDLVSVESYAFQGCRSLEELVLPATVVKIESNFNDNAVLKKCTILSHKQEGLEFGPYIFSSFYGTANNKMDLYLHQSWESTVNGRNWEWDNNKVTFNSITLIDDYGYPVKK